MGAVQTEETDSVLALVIPALEKASGLAADSFREVTIKGRLSPDERAALWLARAILERPIDDNGWRRLRPEQR